MAFPQRKRTADGLCATLSWADPKGKPKRPALVAFEAKTCSVPGRLSPKLTIAQIPTNSCKLVKTSVAVAPWKPRPTRAVSVLRPLEVGPAAVAPVGAEVEVSDAL